LYLSNQQQFAGDTYFVLRAAGDAGALLRGAAAAVQRVDPEQSVFGWQAYPARLERMHWQRVAAARLAAVFALLALALAAVGTYGVLAQSVSQRRRELGVRQALGASASDVAGLVVREGLRPAALGTAVGLGTALALAGAARSLLHDVAPWDVPALLAAALALLLVSLAAGALPAWRAARVEPAVALRQE
jgi:putative ABC transport system permease protein